ncbi:MAG: amphi-Trp domain-containing protein [Solirubrobacterales bacterium]|nr:amphi-Trp domain-containing protein [Solirubrobacterales bacterium]MCB8971158.1 amphi-Trp domain-containing protein [Thermoleophilales bacterium]MCO5325987.1 amphi-Trp domain-containing protein [Solirubrobacterales bacterium]
MSKFEVEKKERITRLEAATRLRYIATILSAEGEEIEFKRGGMEFSVEMPEEIEFKVELELDGDDNELEIEITW